MLAIVPSEKLFLSIFVANAFFMAIFFTRTRFRQPLDNILVIESAVSIAIVAMMVAASFRDQNPAKHRRRQGVPG
jgi:hypothetical protein